MRAHPDADTIMFPSPHWPVVDAIEPLEREIGVSVVAGHRLAGAAPHRHR
jgi:hypothetical protein